MFERPIPARLVLAHAPAGSCSWPAPAGDRRRPSPRSRARGRRVRCSSPCAPPVPTIARRPRAAAWLERQAAARRGAPAPSAPAPAAAGAATAIEKGTPGKLLIFSSVTGHVPVGDVQRSDGAHARSSARTSAWPSSSGRSRRSARARSARRAPGADVSARRQRRPAAESAVLVGARRAAAPRARSGTARRARPPACRREAGTTPRISRSCAAASIADGNGRPEEVRYFDVETNALLRREEDRDLDGNTDTWSRYERGALVERVLDTNADGRPDEWEFYANGRMTLREVDAITTASKDAIYRYRNDSLAEVRRDTDADGAIDHVENFEHRQRVQMIDDANRDERMDTWTTYRVVDGQEVVVRIERDTQGRGKPNVFETYRAAPGQAGAREAGRGRRRRWRDRRDAPVRARGRDRARKSRSPLAGAGARRATPLRSFGNTIAGGTSEIRRDSIAQRVLGLPRR